MDKPAGQTELRILLLEDMPTDAELVEIALREAGLSFIAKRVDTRETFIRALEEFKPDIVLADYKLPAFDGGSAVKIVRQQYPTVPVVMVTGAMGDEKAIELLKLGARDYVLKDQLARLGPAVRRTLSEEQGIRARKAAELALRQSEADLRTLVEHSPIAMLVDVGVDADEKIIMMNRKFTELFGYTLADVPDVRRWWPLAYPDEQCREAIKAEWIGRVEKSILSHVDIEPMEVTVTCRDGSNRYVRVSLASIGGKNIITFEDLTGRRQAEEALRESEARYRRITEGLTDYQYTVRIENGRAVETTQSPACVTVTGYKAEELTANPNLWIQMVAPQDRELVTEHVRQIMAGRDVPPMEHRIIRKDGESRWVSDTAILFKDDSGKLLSYDGVIKDITERKRLEDALKEAADRNRIIMETANDAIICMRPDGTIHLWNHKAEEMFGYTAGEAVGQEMHQLITPNQYREKEIEGFGQFAKTGTGPIVGKTLEVTALRKDGVEFPIELSISAMNIRGEWHATGIIRDITQRKQAEAALARNVHDLGERAKEIGCLYDITKLLLNKKWGVGQALNACTQRIPAGWLDPSHTCARIRLGKQTFETANFRETEWKLAAVIPVSGMEPGLIEVFYFGEITGGGESPFLDEEQNLIQAISTQIAQSLESRQAEARIQKLARLYATLSQTNGTIVRATNREELFSNICTAAVTHGKFALAWVGLVDEATRMVKPICQYGVEEDYLTNIIISADDVPEGRGPTGTSIRENRVSYANDYATDERVLPWREAALKRGFRGAAGLPLRFGNKVIGALTLYTDEPDFFDAEQLNLMEEMATDISFALDGFEREAQRRQAEEGRETALEGSIRVAASISEMRDPYTSGHQRRVGQLAEAIAAEMGLTAAQIEGIHFGSLIHDIGKIGVPAEILSKPSRLTPLEMQLIQIHPKAGYEIVKDIEFPWPVAQMILQHHERLDGAGYPAGLKDGDILLEARIIAVADTVEAMSSHRPYRPGLGIDAALAEITGASGVRYDTQVVEACIRLFREKGFAFKAD